MRAVEAFRELAMEIGSSSEGQELNLRGRGQDGTSTAVYT